MPNSDDVRPLTSWFHPATSSHYVVVGLATCSTNGPGVGEVDEVVYWSVTTGTLHHRRRDEFLDGRFLPLVEDRREDFNAFFNFLLSRTPR